VGLLLAGLVALAIVQVHQKW